MKLKKCAKCGTPFDPDVTTSVFQHEATHDVPLHTAERCLEVVLQELEATVKIVERQSQLRQAAEDEIVRLYGEATGNYGRVDISNIHAVAQHVMNELCQRNTDAGDFFEKLESLKSVLKVIASGKAVDVESLAQDALDSLEEDGPKKFGELRDQLTFSVTKIENKQ